MSSGSPRGRLATLPDGPTLAAPLGDRGVAGLLAGRRNGDLMPIYEYRCTDCGQTFERQQSFSDDPITVCPLPADGTRAERFGARVRRRGPQGVLQRRHQLQRQRFLPQRQQIREPFEVNDFCQRLIQHKQRNRNQGFDPVGRQGKLFRRGRLGVRLTPAASRQSRSGTAAAVIETRPQRHSRCGDVRRRLP